MKKAIRVIWNAITLALGVVAGGVMAVALASAFFSDAECAELTRIIFGS